MEHQLQPGGGRGRQIRASWYASWNGGSRKRLWQIMSWPHVALPHAVVAAVALLLYALLRSGVISL